MDQGRTPNSTCPKCGTSFACGPKEGCSEQAGCWCFEVKLTLDQQEKLSTKFEGCLCPRCLKKYARKSI